MAPNDFNWRVIESIETLIDESGMTRAEVIRRSGMRRNTFFVKMRGETALNTDDISKIADALSVTPESIIVAAANVPTPGDYGLAARKRATDRGTDEGFIDGA